MTKTPTQRVEENLELFSGCGRYEGGEWEPAIDAEFARRLAAELEAEKEQHACTIDVLEQTRRELEVAQANTRILFEIGVELERRGYVHMTNGTGVASILTDLEAAQSRQVGYEQEADRLTLAAIEANKRVEAAQRTIKQVATNIAGAPDNIIEWSAKVGRALTAADQQRIELEAAQQALAEERERQSGAELCLRDLVQALQSAFISIWQSTADWQQQLQAAKEYLDALDSIRAGERGINESPGSRPATLDRNTDDGPQGQVENAGSPASPAPDALVEEIVDLAACMPTTDSSRIDGYKKAAKWAINEWERRKAK